MQGFKPAWLVGVAVAAVGATLLYAQPAPLGKDSTRDKDTSALSYAKLSVKDMSLRYAEMQKQVKDDNRHTLHLREVARKQKDIIKLNCVNDKYVQMKPTTNMFDQYGIELTGALDGSSDTRFGLFTDVAIAAENVKKLRQEADVCVGEPELSTSEYPPEVVGPGVPHPGGSPFDDPIEPPAYASPFK
jgi:hypothetical protein